MGKPDFDTSTTEHQHSSIIKYQPSRCCGIMDETEVPLERQKSSPCYASTAANNTFKMYGLRIVWANMSYIIILYYKAIQSLCLFG